MRRIDKYEIIKEIGRGGFATVYRARDTRIGREVALKVLTGQLAQEPQVVARFNQEAQTAANLHHPHIITVYDFGEVDGALFLAMRLIDGQSLDAYLKEHGRLLLRVALSLLEQVAQALDHLAQRGLVHRDLKPSNVLLEMHSDRFQATLTDFGLVRSLESSKRLTQDSKFWGTPLYTSPEQVRGAEITPLADVYALGTVAYELLTGRPPFVNESAIAVMNAHATMPPPSPLIFAPELGEEVARVLLQNLAKDPSQRFQSAGAFVAALRALAVMPLDELLAQAQAARAVKDWLQLQNICLQILAIDKTNPDVLMWMTEAITVLHREQRYKEGSQFLKQEMWTAAETALVEVATADPNFRDVQSLLVQARGELQRAERYEIALGHMSQEQWAQACRVWLNVLDKRFDYRDGTAAAHLKEAIVHLLKEHAALNQDSIVLKRIQESPTLGPILGPIIETQRNLITTKDVVIHPKTGIELIRIPEGGFLYGNEKKKRKLPEYWMAKTPVTNAQYARFVEAMNHAPPEHWKGKKPPQELADHPVVYVTWEDASAFAHWAGLQLPTEEQWEKAARGVDGRTYPWGNKWWENEWQDKFCNSEEAGIGGTTPVGHFSPQGDSPYGCVDMSGNVWEWTRSWYDTEKKHRALRGGAWNDSNQIVRAAYRFDLDPTNTLGSVGFRCAQE
jgi:serine/threonine protein kinase/formylglycine-generating enzyme required for sulfatase activity